MKKICSLWLILLSLFSCVVFSACGDKFKKLEMNFYSTDGIVLDVADFMIDTTNSSSSKTVGIEFSGIDEDDVGQIVVYSIPNELVTITNYKYNGNKCYVDITPNMSSGENAKLVATHLASGKKKVIDLTINQKSTDLNIINSTYIVSIPDKDKGYHTVDMSKIVSLLPAGSTDKIYFNYTGTVTGVKPIVLEQDEQNAFEDLKDVYTGFEVSNSVEDGFELTIYPVTYMKGYGASEKDYEKKTITIKFRKTLNENNLSLYSEQTNNFEEIKLISNDTNLNTFKLSLKFNETLLKDIERNSYFDFYDVEVVSADKAKISALVETNNDIVLMAKAHTDDYVDVVIILKPKNCVGDIQKVELTAKVKVELRADSIQVSKNGEIVSSDEVINIFDYYEEGNSLGTLFMFKAVSNSSANVHEDLKDMQICVNPEILCKENGGNNSKLYSLMIHYYNDYLKFEYDENLGLMVSEKITDLSRIYIKYVDGDGADEPADFGIEVRTLNNSSIEYWKNAVNPTKISLNFNRLEGVKSMALEVGYYQTTDNGKYVVPTGQENLQYVYLNVYNGLDNQDADRTYINVVNNSVEGVDGGKIDSVNFYVEVTPLTNVENPLTIAFGIVDKDDKENNIKVLGNSTALYLYDKGTASDIICLIYRSETSLGDYKITFYQEGIEKVSVICRVYAELSEITRDMVSVETNKTAFKNSYLESNETKYLYSNYQADYIVASGQDLLISIDLPDNVINSNIVSMYSFSATEVKNGNDLCFDIKQDNSNNNYALMSFIHGTYIDGLQYISVTISVERKTYPNIVTETTENVAPISITFFIYEEIKDEDLSINHSYLTKYMSDYLGIYHEDNSKASLQVSMSDDALWKYTTGENEIDWKIDELTSVVVTEDKTNHLYNLQFGKVLTGQTSYTRIVKAYVYQFDNVFEVQCVIDVKKPVLTEKLIIKSDVEITDDDSQTYYINLKKGETYQMVAENYSSLGDVTNSEIIIQVADQYGSAYSAKNYFNINQNKSEITVKEISQTSQFKLIVFAKDVLDEIVSSDKSGYNFPSMFIKNDYTGIDLDRYTNAYFVLDIILSDGSSTNPYLINSADDFWQIDDTEEFRNKDTYCKLMTNISLDNTTDKNEKTISGFAGHIVTHLDQTYMVDGIILNNTTRNLFAGFKGEISNIKFVVKYYYEITSNLDEANSVNLGLFDVNAGTLNNVSVVIDLLDGKTSKANLKGSTIYYFGGLVGENSGTIQYTSGVGVTGQISLSGNYVYFGGLVGKNIGKILGCEVENKNEADEVVLNSAEGREDAISLIEINSTLTSTSSAIGGVIGLNTYVDTQIGTIQNAFVQETINAETSSNVGGVIGENIQPSISWDVSYNGLYITIVNDNIRTENEQAVSILSEKTNAIYNVKSVSTINAKNNIGGIVGLDTNGLYIECDYQILNSEEKTISIVGQNNVGGIAGNSTYGKFAYCSVMSYNWNYNSLNSNTSAVITDVADISGVDNVGGIVGLATSDESNVNSGSNSISNKVFVVSSSVNAYLVATRFELTGNIGGILSSKSGISLIYNAYFIGKLEGNVYYVVEQITENGITTDYHFALDNNGKSLFNAVYSFNIVDGNETTLKYGYIKDDALFTITQNPDLSYWWWNTEINGGYIFITTDTDEENENKKPIFDLVPESVSVTVKGEEEGSKLERVLQLKFYDFSIDTALTDVELSKLNAENNRNQKLIDLLNFVVKPRGLGKTVINVKSSNTNIVDVTYDGKLLINGVGECYLTFSAALNKNEGDVKQRTIKVVVDYPIGDTFNISTSQTDKSKIVTTTQEIPKDSSRQYYVLSSGSKNGYSYRTKTNLNLKVEVSISGNVDIEEYVQISGQKGIFDEENNILTIDLDAKTPFIISVLKKLESGTFNIKVTPYRVIEVDDEEVEVYYYIDENNETDENKISSTFNLSTMAGATNASFSYDEAIVYPNDTVYLTMLLETDVALCANLDGSIDISSLQSLINDLISRNAKDQGFSLNIKKSNENIKFNVYVDWSKYDSNLQIQTIVLRIEFAEMELSTEESLVLIFETSNDNSAEVKYTIIPQRINKIEIKNYYYNSTTQKVEQLDVLKPNSAGYIIIDLVPNNGYYKYLEISDITGSEEIVFIQIDKNGNALSLSSDPSIDGKGIKLYSDSTANQGRLYVKTQISNTYSSKMHTVQVRAYLANRTLLARFNKLIDVKMMPEINATYVLPDGRDGAVIQTSENRFGDLYLANGVDANFRVQTANSNSELECYITGTNADGSEWKDVEKFYSWKNVANNLYVLNSTYNQENIGKKVKITWRTYAYIDNGDYDMAECSVEFEIVDFVIHGVSVNQSIDNANTTEIYGYYDRDITLNFYLDETDISYYDGNSEQNGNNPFWDTVYTNGDTYDKTNTTLVQIYEILAALNNESGTNQYLILNKNKKKNNEYTETLSQGDVFSQTNNTQKIQLWKNKLTVQEGYDKEEVSNTVVDDPKYLAVAFKIYYDTTQGDTGWKIEEYTQSFATGVKNYSIDKNYKLSFRKVTPWNEPEVINTSEQFIEMQSGGQYILNADITLESYSPLDINLVEFDGNGHTITINSFALFNDQSIQAGLFKQIYDGMIVKNVVVSYESTNKFTGDWTFGNVSTSAGLTYTDLCNNADVAYTDAKFGGIAAINNGIVTNCKVTGQIAVNVSTLEKKSVSTGGNYEVNFEIGGMVAENSSTGYITNSTSELSIFALANIGGFVHSNAGKIVSCGVESGTTIYGYNVNLGNTIIVEMAGFAVKNTNEISMSYVNFKKGELAFGSIYYGTMSAKDISAGFVYSNSGKIYDAYVQMTETGINNNSFAGFVYSNSGTITRAYTYINGGSKNDNNDTMFAPAGTKDIENCIEFVISKSGYTSGIETGLITEDVANKYNKNYYEKYGFAFGDNESAVWFISAGYLPKLVSTQEFTFKGITIKEKEKVIENDFEKVTYEYIDTTYGTKNNPFIIHDLETWNKYFDYENNQGRMIGYYRIVKDIDFSLVGGNPKTSSLTFKGNIQGNNMKLTGIMLYSSSRLSSIGLFEKLESADDHTIKNSVRNLTISTTSVWASSTEAVGVLAGIIENFNIYNITIDSEGVIMVGKNAVGGLAGIIRGEFDIDQISSNIGANSTRASTLSAYSIYMSKSNSVDVSQNLNSVYYAGSVVGILDGYNSNNYNVSNEKGRDITKKYYNVQHVSVGGKLVVYGDTVGGAFGFVGEQVYVKYLSVNISGALSGVQYSAGAVGENRGIVDIATIILADNIFEQSHNVSAGVVGFNLGGLIRNANATANITKTSYGQIIGGIIGRNVYGVVAYSHFDGTLFGYITGGIVGADYDADIMKKVTAGSSALESSCRLSTNLIPSKQVKYLENGTEIEKYSNVSLSLATLKNMIENVGKFYSFKQSDNVTDLNGIISKNKVLGLVVGLSYVNSPVTKTDGVYNILLNSVSSQIVFNSTSTSANIQNLEAILKYGTTEEENITYTFENVNVIDIDMELENVKVVYLVGATTSSFDSWAGYSSEYVIFQ